MAIFTITQQDLVDFYSSHFAPACINHFSSSYLKPKEHNENFEDDGLGYYEDGTKRTLTDEQIAIFRHSELFREESRLKSKRVEDEDSSSKVVTERKGLKSGKNDEGQNNSTQTIVQSDKCLTKRERKAIKAKQKGYFRHVIKPDLRKRTWDNVEVGLGCLDYDDLPNKSAADAKPPPQRRRVTYDD
ncbi:hypothetical protein GcM3_073003 [Golovinomyces cichoracearum]|uniref:Uncharacterized protein n=1 Tax=Golovinomyces cichoracearum TaxID=62708 RepID=A0A420IRQ4_9PEZI|nr:hypothetical protein GcM3_073003 [Golovinomyces cichoracearum]